MKLRTHLAVAAMLLTFGFASAEASPISFDYNFEPAADVLINVNGGVCSGNTATGAVTGQEHHSCESLAFAYLLDGYNPAIDTLTSASLTLTFYDDNTPGPDVTGFAETVNITLDGALSSNSPVQVATGSGSGNPFLTPAFDVTALLQSDGQLTVFLSRPGNGGGNNDFYFANARLLADGVRDEAELSVPEPVTLGLLGAGLVAVTVRRRRR